MVTCVAVNCKNRSGKSTSSSDVSFHRFPKDKHRRTIWTMKLRRQNWKPSDSSFICSRHFSCDSFETPTEYGMRRHLKKDATPTIFARPTHLAVKKNKRMKLKRKQKMPKETSISFEDNHSFENLSQIQLDHNYNLPDPVILKRRLEIASRQNVLLVKKLHEYKKLLVKRFPFSRFSVNK